MYTYKTVSFMAYISQNIKVKPPLLSLLGIWKPENSEIIDRTSIEYVWFDYDVIKSSHNLNKTLMYTYKTVSFMAYNTKY